MAAIRLCCLLISAVLTAARDDLAALLQGRAEVHGRPEPHGQSVVLGAKSQPALPTRPWNAGASPQLHSVRQQEEATEEDLAPELGAMIAKAAKKDEKKGPLRFDIHIPPVIDEDAGECIWVANNTQLRSRGEGLLYRFAPTLKAIRGPWSHLPWGAHVRGKLDKTHTWLKVDNWIHQWLPLWINGSRVLNCDQAMKAGWRFADLGYQVVDNRPEVSGKLPLGVQNISIIRPGRMPDTFDVRVKADVPGAGAHLKNYDIHDLPVKDITPKPYLVHSDRGQPHPVQDSVMLHFPVYHINGTYILKAWMKSVSPMRTLFHLVCDAEHLNHWVCDRRSLFKDDHGRILRPTDHAASMGMRTGETITWEPTPWFDGRPGVSPPV